MSNEQDGSDGQDPIKQLKSEFSRKNDNLASQLAESQRKIDQIMNAVMQQQQVRPPAREADEEVDADPISDPDKFRKQVTRAAAREAAAAASAVEQKMQEQRARENQINQETNTVLNKLVNEYPELNDRSSDMYIRTQEILASMPSSEKNSPTAIKIAALEAAAETDTKPKSKRPKTSDVDDFTVKGNRGSSREERSSSKSNITNKMTAFAELIGRPVDDPKYLERLEKTATRKNWSKWQK